MNELMRRGAVPLYLLLCLLLGGASGAGIFANLALQLVGATLLFWAIAAKPTRSVARAEQQLLWLAALMVGLVLLQLIPMPPALWSRLPGREPIASGFELLGGPLPWLPVSLAPHQTMAAAVGLLPPLAILVAMLRIGYDARWIAWTIIGVALASVLIGVVQVAGEEDLAWRTYEFTSAGMTGLFANSNHLATLLLISIPLAAAFLRRPDRAGERGSRFPFVPVAALAVLGVGSIVSGSLAGLLLLVPVAIGTLLCFAGGVRHRMRWLALLLGGLGITVVVADISLLRNPGGEVSGSAVPRQEPFRLTIAAAADHMPAGSGIGTFVEVYRAYEDPLRVDTTYMNHTHNDYLELALEAGLPGVALILLFLLWWLARARAVLASDRSVLLAPAATVASAAVLLHSVADYPLRTAAIGAVFAACCVLMVQSAPPAQEERA